MNYCKMKKSTYYQKTNLIKKNSNFTEIKIFVKVLFIYNIKKTFAYAKKNWTKIRIFAILK